MFFNNSSKEDYETRPYYWNERLKATIGCPYRNVLNYNKEDDKSSKDYGNLIFELCVEPYQAEKLLKHSPRIKKICNNTNTS